MESNNAPKGATLCLPVGVLEYLDAAAEKEGTSFSAQIQRRLLIAKQKGVKLNQPTALERERASRCVSLRPSETDWLDGFVSQGLLYSRATGVTVIVEKEMGHGKTAVRVGAKKTK